MGLENSYYKVHSFTVEKQGNGAYNITRYDYLNGNLVGQYTSTVEGVGGVEQEENVGVYQSLHPSTYLTDTSVQDVPLDLTNRPGLLKAFMNCSSLTSIDLDNDIIAPSVGAINNGYAFDGCSSLSSISLGTILRSQTTSENWLGDSDDIVSKSYLCMFNNCSSLSTISGEIGFTGVTPAMLVDMFGGCTNLNCTGLKIYNGPTDSVYDLFQKYRGNTLVVGDRSVTYSYELLGLTKAQLHQATIYSFESGNVISNFEILL